VIFGVFLLSKAISKKKSEAKASDVHAENKEKMEVHSGHSPE
jgi:hypothetical protein